MAVAGFTKYPLAATFAATIEGEAAAAGLPPALVYGVIAQESAFNFRAYRAEPHINDASRGLMQILYGTARDVGYTGQPDGLYDPAINVRLGVKFLADRIRAKAGDVWAGVSAYNNGNGNRATSDVRVCVWRKPDGSCGEYHDARAGEFFNQPYVDSVRQKAELFGLEGDAGAGGSAAVVALLVVGVLLARRIIT